MLCLVDEEDVFLKVLPLPSMHAYIHIHANPRPLLSRCAGDCSASEMGRFTRTLLAASNTLSLFLPFLVFSFLPPKRYLYIFSPFRFSLSLCLGFGGSGCTIACLWRHGAYGGECLLHGKKFGERHDSFAWKPRPECTCFFVIIIILIWELGVSELDWVHWDTVLWIVGQGVELVWDFPLFLLSL